MNVLIKKKRIAGIHFQLWRVLSGRILDLVNIISKNKKIPEYFSK